MLIENLLYQPKGKVIWPVPAAKYFTFCSSLALKPIVDRTGNKLLRAAGRSPGTAFALHLSKSPRETKKLPFYR